MASECGIEQSAKIRIIYKNNILVFILTGICSHRIRISVFTVTASIDLMFDKLINMRNYMYLAVRACRYNSNITASWSIIWSS